MRAIALLFGLLAAAFLTIAVGAPSGTGSLRAGEPANAKQAHSTMKKVILIGANGSTSNS